MDSRAARRAGNGRPDRPAPIPGRFDKALLLLIAPVFIGFYRGAMREAWQRAGS